MVRFRDKSIFVVGFWWLWDILTTSLTNLVCPMSFGPPLDHYLSGYQDRLHGGPLGLPNLCRTVPAGVRRKDHGGEVLG
jgi:hypothetical protein